MDLCRVPDTDAALAVIVDYKSSGHELDATRLYHGLELQLLAYLGALSHLTDPQGEFNVARLLAAGYFLGRGDGTFTDASSRLAMLSGGVRTGITYGDYDNDGRIDLYVTFIRHPNMLLHQNQDGSFSKKGNEAMPAAQFRALLKQIEDFLRHYGQAIHAGDARVSPFRKGKETACDRCDYRPICRFDPWTELYRVLRPPPKPTEAVVGGKTSGKSRS